MFNQTVDYAFRMLRTMTEYTSTPMRMADVARESSVPVSYGVKVLKDLVKRGILRARKGIGTYLPGANFDLPLFRVLSALDVWAWEHGDYGSEVNPEMDRLYRDFCATMERLTIGDLSALPSYKEVVTE